MKFFCDQKELLRAINTVSRAITPNPTLPVLNNIYIKAEGKKVFFAGTNLDIAIKYVISADVRNEGAITIPSKVITSFVSLLPEEKVEFSVSEGVTLTIKSKSDETKIKGVSADEFPLIPEIEKDTVLVVPTETLKTAINQTAFAAAPTTTRPTLNGVYLTVDKNNLTLAATDSFRLAERKSSIKGKDEPLTCIIPSRTLIETGRLLNEERDKNTQITVAKNQVLFQNAGFELSSRLIEGKYPDYEKIIPKESKTIIEIKREPLTTVVKRVSIFAREDNNSVKLSVTHDGKLMVASTETKAGEEKAELEVKMSGENNRVTVNAQYLLDVLDVITDESVKISINDKFSPAMVQPLRNDGYTYIIMPLKV